MPIKDRCTVAMDHMVALSVIGIKKQWVRFEVDMDEWWEWAKACKARDGILVKIVNQYEIIIYGPYEIATIVVVTRGKPTRRFTNDE